MNASRISPRATELSARTLELIDKAAGYPSEAVYLEDGRPAGIYTLRAVEPVEDEQGVSRYPITAEIEAVMASGATRLTSSERQELESVLRAAPSEMKDRSQVE